MKCSRCHRELEEGLKQCNYCGAKVKRFSFRKWLERLGTPKPDEEKLVRGMATGQLPDISSVEELRLYLKHSIRDEEFASLLVEIFQKIGGGGAIQIKKGGDGNPYSVEYSFSERPKHLPRSQISQRMDELRWALEQAKSTQEEERLQEELSELAGASATIWVNSPSDQELEKARRLLQNAMDAVDRAFR